MPNHKLNTTTFPSLNVYLKSEDASIHYSSSHKVFQLKTHINQSARPDVQTLVGLTNFECPYSFYLINQFNDKIGIKVGNVENTFSITHGNYDIYTLMNEIDTKLFDLKDTLNAIITTSFDEVSQKLTFHSSNANTIGFLASTSCDRILGLENALPTSDANLSVNFVCPNCCNLSGTSSIYIKLRGLGLNNLNSLGDTDETLSKINVEVLPSNFIFYEDEAENIYYLIDNNIINSLEIELVDDRGNQIEFNGGFFSMVLTFHFVYRREETINSKAFLFNPNIPIKEDKK